MSQLPQLVQAYETHIALPWKKDLAGAQKVIMLVYPREEERSLRHLHLQNIATTTQNSGHGWFHLDWTHAISRFLVATGYSDAYFAEPELIEGLEKELVSHLADHLEAQLRAAGPEDVVALSGITELFGYCRLSEVIGKCETHIRGRLLIFFPGEYQNNNYRLLGARDGWDYHALPICLQTV